MARTTSINLGDHFTGFIAELTNSGRYKNASEAVREGLRLLEERETEYQTKLANLRQMLIEGEESGESESSIEDIWQEVKAEFDAK